MINPIVITSGLSGLIGFRAAVDKSLPKIDADLQASESGIIVNDVHPLVSVENIHACIENSGVIEYPDAWAVGTTYTLDEKVIKVIDTEKVIYKSLADGNVGNDPEISPDEWESEGTVFNQYLRNKLSQGAVKLANVIYLQKNLADNSKSILGDVMLYTGAGNITNTITKRGRFVGFKLYIKGSDLAVTLSKVGMQFNTLNPEFKLYIYHNSQLEPISEITIAHTKQYSFEWKSITKQILSFLDDDINAGGHFSIGYYEDDLLGEAIERKTTYDFNGHCGSCQAENFNNWKKWSKHVSIQPFYVDAANLNEDHTYWDEEKEIVLDEQNWGLNFIMSVGCDVTPFLIRNKGSLAQVYATQIAVSILEDMAMSTRDNQKMLKVQQLANYALNMKENYSPGMYKQLEKEIKALNFNISGLNPQCLPCKNSGYSVKTGSVFR